MKPVIIIAIAFVLLIPLTVFAQSEDLEGIELELLEWQKIESDKSDVLILTISFINNGKYVSNIIPNYVFLVDSQERTFGPSFYSELQEKGFPVTSEDCPIEFHTSSNPGLSSEEILCYEVPKGIGDSFSLNLWSSLPSLCGEYYVCTIISLSVTLAQQTEPTPLGDAIEEARQRILSDPNLDAYVDGVESAKKIPDWVKNIYLWKLHSLVHCVQEMLDALLEQ